MQLLRKTDGFSVVRLIGHKTKRAPGYWCKILLEKLKLSYSAELMQSDLSPTTQLLSWTLMVDSVRLGAPEGALCPPQYTSPELRISGQHPFQLLPGLS